MALALGTNKGSWVSSSSNPITESGITLAANSKVFVLLMAYPESLRSNEDPTFGGTNLLKANALSRTDGTGFLTSELWYLVNPSLSSSTLSIPNPSSYTIYYSYISFTTTSASVYFNQTGNTGTTANPSLTINDVPAGGACAAVLADGYKTAPTGRSHTAIVEVDQGAWSNSCQYGLIAALSNVTMSWTVAADNWAMIMAAFQEGLAALDVSTLQSAKLSEDLTASVAAQTTLSPSVSESAKLTEVLGAEVMAPVVEPLEVDDPQQTAKLTEELAVSVSAQPTLEASTSQAARITEDLAISAPQIALAPNISESARLTEDKTVTVSTQITLETSQVESARATEEYVVSVSTPVTLEVSPTETAKATEELAAEIGAMLAMEVSTLVETAKASEDLAGAVESPVTLEASITDNAKGTEVIGAAVVGGEVVEDLNVQVTSESVHIIDYIAPPLQQSFSATEVITAEITAQTVLAPSVEQSAKVTKDLAVAVATQVALEPSISDNAKVIENLAASVASQPTLEVPKCKSSFASRRQGISNYIAAREGPHPAGSIRVNTISFN